MVFRQEVVDAFHMCRVPHKLCLIVVFSVKTSLKESQRLVDVIVFATLQVEHLGHRGDADALVETVLYVHLLFGLLLFQLLLVLSAALLG